MVGFWVAGMTMAADYVIPMLLMMKTIHSLSFQGSGQN